MLWQSIVWYGLRIKNTNALAQNTRRYLCPLSAEHLMQHIDHLVLLFGPVPDNDTVDEVIMVTLAALLFITSRQEACNDRP